MNKTYEEVVRELIEEPKYSSDWIDIAAKLISEFNYTVDKLEKFNNKQLNIIYNANKRYGEDNVNPDAPYISAITNPKFNDTQMQLLDTARQNDIEGDELKRLMNPSLSYSKLNYLVQSLIDGYDIAKEYNVDNLSIGQIYEIYAAFKSGIDISSYFSPDNTELSDNQLAIMRHAAELGLNAKYDKSTKQIIITEV